jgi:hypothetical protein
MDARFRRLEALVVRARWAADARRDAAAARHAHLAAEALASARSGRYGSAACADLLACGEWYALRAVDAGDAAPHLVQPVATQFTAGSLAAPV